MLAALRKFAQKNVILRKLLGYHLVSSGLFDSFFKNYKEPPEWTGRISNVLKSPDNEFIPRVAGAGEISHGTQLLHNGLKIYLGSYYGPEFSKLLMLSKGVHEPQEERVFMEVLKTLPGGALMIEMGAFWSFYSMWFNKEIRGARNFMIEPDGFNLGQGKRNFRLNKMHGTFVKSFVGKSSGHDSAGDTRCIDDFVKEHAIEFIHMLHSDIQGFEYDMLIGAANAFRDSKIGYIFISTHSNKLHYDCLEFLRKEDFIVIASVDLDESYSEDGFIAARSRHINGVDQVPISKRSIT